MFIILWKYIQNIHYYVGTYAYLCTYIHINISGVCATRKTKMRDLKKTVFIYRFFHLCTYFFQKTPLTLILPFSPPHSITNYSKSPPLVNLFFLLFTIHPTQHLLPTFCVRTCCPFLNNEKGRKRGIKKNVIGGTFILNDHMYQRQ